MSRPHLTDVDWRIAERDLALAPAALESVFAVGNGYLGVRGTSEDGTAAHDPGVVLNGFHETWPIVYPEDAYGLARTGQTIVAPPDASIVRLAVAGGARVLHSERTLDMRRGVLLREATLAVPGGRLLVRSRRLASLADPHLVSLELELTMLEGAAELTLTSELVVREDEAGGEDDPRRGKGFGERVLQPVSARADGTRAVLEHVTARSGLRLASGIEHRLGGVPAEVASSAGPDGAEVVVHAHLTAGETLRLEKLAAYHWAEDGELAARVADTLDLAQEAGNARIEAAHAHEVGEFWRRSDVVVEGPDGLQRTVRFNLFQVMQATARGEGLGVSAKGVTGRGYEGHYFWDTEVYVIPFLVHTSPEWAKRLLEFRCGMLGAARRRAREVGHTGALYPWRTLDGREASAWYAAGTAQYHINADIAYAMHHYNRVTGDLGFMLDRGAQVLVETARLWMELGYFSERQGGRFCINGVTGPDEYTTVVDDNAYTNLMAKENLEVATRVMEWLEATDPEAHAALARDTGLRDEEVDGWRRAAEAMHVPRHEELGIVLQDSRFLERKRWDFAGTPPEKHPLLLHFHPLELYRHQVIKQADVVLATYLVGHHFDKDEKRRTFDYYDPLTTGDSTLSACIQSVMASEVGYPSAALDYFMRACTVDLADLHGNTGHGIHIASCGGTWLALVAGFGGLRDADGDVRFAPRLPREWRRLCFRIEVRGQLIEVDMTPEATAYRLLEGRGLPIEHFGEPLRLAPGAAVVRPATTALPGPQTGELPRAA
jgi:alpha,alpha-trehalose phosphorylase